MMDLLWGALSFLVPGAGLFGIVGLVIKILARFGLGSASALSVPLIGPVLAFVLRLAEKFVDAVGSRLLAGADHISKNVYSAVLVLLLVTLAWNFGPGKWRFWDSTAQPTISEPAKRAAASKSPSRPPAPRCTDPLSACFWDNLLR